jgi:hypothetical protein
MVAAMLYDALNFLHSPLRLSPTGNPDVQNKVSKKTLLISEGSGFLLIVAALWLNEICDLPHLLFGAAPTDINWQESIFETSLVLALACITMSFNHLLLKKIQRLEKLLPICAHCKSIRKDDGSWEQVDDYISSCTGAEFTHTICPVCATLLYPEEYPPTNPSKSLSRPPA